MGLIVDLVQQNTGTTGTGTLTLGSAVTGFRTIAGAGIADGTVVSYAIQDGTNRETGTGTVGGSGTTLTRNFLTSSTNALLSLTGSAVVGIAANAADFAPQANMAATAAPTVSNDNTQGYVVGSQWLWAARGLLWTCLDASTSAAVWEISSFASRPSGNRSVIYYTDLHESPWAGADALLTPPWFITQSGTSIFPDLINPQVDANASGRGTRRIRTGTSATGFCALTQQQTNTSIGDTYRRYGYLQRIVDVPSATQDFEWVFGTITEFNSTVSSNTDFAVFRLRWNGSAVEFSSSSRNGNGTIQTNVLTAPTTNTWFSAEIEIPPSTGNILFIINGTTVASHSTRPAPTAGMRHGTALRKTVGTSEVVGDVDALYLQVGTMR